MDNNKSVEGLGEIRLIDNSGQVEIWFDNTSLIIPSTEFKIMINEYGNKMKETGITAILPFKL